MQQRVGVFFRLRSQSGDLRFHCIKAHQNIGHRGGRRSRGARGSLAGRDLRFEKTAVTAGEHFALQGAHFGFKLAQTRFIAGGLRQRRHGSSDYGNQRQTGNQCPVCPLDHHYEAPVIMAYSNSKLCVWRHDPKRRLNVALYVPNPDEFVERGDRCFTTLSPVMK